MGSVTYADAGVDISKADGFVRHIKKAVRSTYSKSVLSDIGAFGGFYDARFKGLKSPVLVSSVDGVGTKLKVAQLLDRHDTVGQDLVNHCVNDIAVCGAVPMFFMDYFATGKLADHVAVQVIEGFIKACRENKCSLIGGETAEMPGFYADNQYDLAGTIVGVAERKKIITGDRVRKKDVLIGIPSTGLHTNGYSLARKVLLEKYSLNDHVPSVGTTLGDALLTIHRSYLEVIRRVRKKFDVHGLAHITGGGIEGNTQRVVPKGLAIKIDWTSWNRPPIFQLIQETGQVPEEDMRRTFNLGVGLVIIVQKKESSDLLKFLKKNGEVGFYMGEVVANP
ncbi:MAG: phosphoribosylformylglycinamidine cyclo-ligase [Bacteroidota bacterium]